ncbi:hypothetical protein SETIT_7G200600v2 [Setaria italica]|uniref:Uncharacterized protein n=1 Tax=Setaria italica TaxID=4555 RepID=A0A368RXQ8_SETIT|nr:hypothetical protein SETIT_7G200600v2 [Setaria italica]
MTARRSGSPAVVGRPELGLSCAAAAARTSGYPVRPRPPGAPALPNCRRDCSELEFPNRRWPPEPRPLSRRCGRPELTHSQIRPCCRELGEQGFLLHVGNRVLDPAPSSSLSASSHGHGRSQRRSSRARGVDRARPP